MSNLLILWLCYAVLANAVGQPCLLSNNRLDPNSHKFSSDCGPTEYCAPAEASFPSAAGNTLNSSIHPTQAVRKRDNGRTDSHNAHKRGYVQNVFLASGVSNGTMTSNGIKSEATTAPSATCQPKGCRKDEYPFGYGQNDILPPRCAKDQFCPDEEDECQPLVPLGSPCQLNRDDECQPPANATLLSNDNNFNGSICLTYTCMYADIELGDECIIDNTVYSGYLPDGSQFTDIVSRDNCMTGLYCASGSSRCEQRLLPGQPCASDNQCLSGNCDVTDLCVLPPETITPIPAYLHILVPLGIIVFLLCMVAGLWSCHRRARRRRAKMMHEYWTEQLSYRKSIMSMHIAANHESRQPDSGVSLASKPRLKKRISTKERYGRRKSDEYSVIAPSQLSEHDGSDLQENHSYRARAKTTVR